MTNKHTPAIRQLVTSFINTTDLECFSVKDVKDGLGHRLDAYASIDLVKALSNDLIRRQSKGWLRSFTGEPSGVGRPVRVYSQMWKM